ncbi:hypothetical protein P7K49_032721 [Saguinus oedipus]|uniref:Uncharacterized protein n=1 Tax=Saguinus oedipus TaxID=9490 RepID=A0ABQ9TQ85_SAGOE|nr:hypothetical protein P7K49_032721 [Saguinus oedipus]
MRPCPLVEAGPGGSLGRGRWAGIAWGPLLPLPRQALVLVRLSKEAPWEPRPRARKPPLPPSETESVRADKNPIDVSPLQLLIALMLPGGTEPSHTEVQRSQLCPNRGQPPVTSASAPQFPRP